MSYQVLFFCLCDYFTFFISGKRKGKFLNIGEASNVLPALAMMSWADVKGKCPNLSKKLIYSLTQISVQ